MTRFTAILCLPYLLVQLQQYSAHYADAYAAPSLSFVGQRIAMWVSLSSTSISDHDDLSDLWNSEEDHEDDLWPDTTSVSRRNIGQEKQVTNESDVGSLTLSKEPPEPHKKLDRSDVVVSGLWGVEEEDEDDEVWPGATDEMQRLKLLQETMQELPPAPPAPQPKQPIRRRLPRPPEFWDLRLELIREYHVKYGHIDVPYRYTVHGRGETVKLGSFMYWLRSLFEAETLKVTAPFEFAKELTQLGMKWRFLGKGRRHQLFLQRLNEWRDADRNERMEPTLRTWMWRQRYQFVRQCEGLPSTLTAERIDALVDAGIVPYQRPLKTLQSRWDATWNQNLKEWTAFSASQQTVAMNPSLTLWTWEQWRMYDILRGDTPYKGELPVLLTGFRVKCLQDVAFFESERPVPNLTPPDVENSASLIEWSDFMDAIKSYFFDNGSFDIQSSCEIRVGGDSLYSIVTRLNREHKVIRRSEVVEGRAMLLNNERTQELEDLAFFRSKSLDPLQSEFEWWDKYHEFKKGRRDFFNGQKRTGSVSRWIDEQHKRFDNLRDQNGPDGISEAHYESLRSLGVVFSVAEEEEPPAGRNAVANVVGRPPSLVTLNKDVLQDEGFQLRKQGDVLEELTWHLRYNELKDFANSKGHCFVPSSVLPRLALWANNQRLQYRKSMQGTATPLNDERILMLKEIDFDFGVNNALIDDDEEWSMMTQALKGFQNMHKHCFVPVALSSNPQLGEWVNRQRQAYQRQELPRQKVQKLQEIGLLLEIDDVQFYRSAFDVTWDERVAELKKLVERNGHGDIDETTLSSWTAQQRRFYLLLQGNKIPSRLTKERIDQLENLGLDWTKN